MNKVPEIQTLEQTMVLLEREIRGGELHLWLYTLGSLPCGSMGGCPNPFPYPGLPVATPPSYSILLFVFLVVPALPTSY